jgi:glycosyltransferase involved in cell wall biosynthesis
VVKILYVCLQPRGGGGASDTHVAGLVEALRKDGHRVHLVETREVDGDIVARAIAGVQAQLVALKQLRSSDLVWLRMHPLGAIAAFLTKSSRLVVEVNGVEEDFYVAYPILRRFAPVLRASLRYQLRRARMLLPVTAGLAAKLREQFPDKEIVVAPNAVNPNIFAPRYAKPVDAPRRYVVFFGALTSWQGIDIALDATVHPAWPKDLRLLVIGDGPERPLVAAAEASRPDRVVFRGPLAPADVPSYVAHARASLLPKRYHDVDAGQSPLKLYESLAAGVPVIATPSIGVTDLPAFKGLLHVAEPNARSIAETVALATSDDAESLARGLAGRAVVLEGHTWEHRVATVMGALSGCRT